MAETHVNFLGGSPLNRLSWLRSSTPFLSAVLAKEETRWILFQGGQPLVKLSTTSKDYSLACLTTDNVKRLLGPEPVFGHGSQPGQAYVHHEPIAALEAVRIHGPSIVFLGLHEPDGTDERSALPSSDFSAKMDPQMAASNIEGTPYFALDVSDASQDDLAAVIESTVVKDAVIEFVEPRAATSMFSAFEAAVFAEARSMIDWNVRNGFCPACGSPTYSVWAGWKLSCSSLLPWADNSGRKPCPSTKGIHNFSHPRTDPVVIMAVIDESVDKILLGRNRKFPGGFYSTLAGFIEPGESFEDAVKREIWEEAGVRVWGVKYHSGQPWPYPANLMVGFYAFADSMKPINLELDNELVDARWYSRAEIQTVLAHPQGHRITRQEYKKFDDDDSKKPTAQAEQSSDAAAGHAALAPSDPAVLAGSQTSESARRLEPPAFRVPPVTAIAGVLIRDWSQGLLKSGGAQKGSNL